MLTLVMNIKDYYIYYPPFFPRRWCIVRSCEETSLLLFSLFRWKHSVTDFMGPCGAQCMSFQVFRAVSDFAVLCEISHFTLWPVHVCAAARYLRWLRGVERETSVKPQKEKNNFPLTEPCRVIHCFLWEAVTKWAGEYMHSWKKYTVIHPMVCYHSAEIHCVETVFLPRRRQSPVVFAHSSQNFISSTGRINWVNIEERKQESWPSHQHKIFAFLSFLAKE